MTMTDTGIIGFAPASASLTNYLIPHQEWLQSVLGCPAFAWLTLEVADALGDLICEDLLKGVPLDLQCPHQPRPLRPYVERWELPEGQSPRIALYPSKKKEGLITEGVPGWDPHWLETPIAVWLRGTQHAVVAAKIPYVSYNNGLEGQFKEWLLVNREEVAHVLKILRQALSEGQKKVVVIGGRDINLTDTGYAWDRIVLDQPTRELVQNDFEHFLNHEKWFVEHGLPFRRGYLFHGPPGNGKTSVIRIMASHPFISSFSLDFGNAELRNDALTALFEEAGNNAPSLVIFEDLDRIYGKEGRGENRTSISIQHLLNCLDGLGSQDGVIVVATANDLSEIDPAILRRPGRFDRVVNFSSPSTQLREEYFTLLSKRKLDTTNLRAALQSSEGLSFAELREAYILAGQLAFQNGLQISAEDLREGIDLVIRSVTGVGCEVGGRKVGFGGKPFEDGAK